MSAQLQRVFMIDYDIESLYVLHLGIILSKE